ncbi:hypothetical protein [Paenibacillus sp. HB172176]|uniref:hypothetical protein n=1 Tax=Paenibacillus sp. HB172176 TaxID=2493690 RepID=UPI00143AC8E0|nr:hypothetical protein [Paenibacillus sp. HB172176]
MIIIAYIIPLIIFLALIYMAIRPLLLSRRASRTLTETLLFAILLVLVGGFIIAGFSDEEAELSTVAGSFILAIGAFVGLFAFLFKK